MDRTKLLAIALVLSLAACGGRDKEIKRGQQQYDVVEEGSASGVSSTINPLNEPVRPPAPLTNTAVDTTTNFTLPNTMPPATVGGGSIASSLPQPVYVPPSRPAPRPRPAQPAPAPESASMASSTPPPAQTDTTTPPPATTAKTETTENSTDPARHVEGENKEKTEEKKSETPPPPPPTDTVGG